MHSYTQMLRNTLRCAQENRYNVVPKEGVQLGFKKSTLDQIRNRSHTFTLPCSRCGKDRSKYVKPSVQRTVNYAWGINAIKFVQLSKTGDC